MSVVVKFMIVEVLDDKELPNNCVCKETKFTVVQKTGEANITTFVLFPPGFLMIQNYFLGKLCIGKVELLSYKKVFIVTVVRLS